MGGGLKRHNGKVLVSRFISAKIGVLIIGGTLFVDCVRGYTVYICRLCKKETLGGVLISLGTMYTKLIFLIV